MNYEKPDPKAITGWRITRAEGAAMLASYGVYVGVLAVGAAP